MRKLIIERTANTPRVNFDPDNYVFEISGESRPIDADKFFSEILKWLSEYSSYIIRAKEIQEPVFFNFDLEYFNSPSAKYILEFCKILATVRTKGRNVRVKWQYDKDDYDMYDFGKEMSRIANIPFDYNQK
jgi:hypothetical protein